MAQTIKLKRASGSNPSASDLSVGELAIRTSNCALFSKNDAGNVVQINESQTDENFTTALKNKLDGIAASATNVTNNNQLTNGAGYITSTLTQEQVEDFVGSMVSGNTETGITVTYQDSDGTLDFVVASQTDNNFTNTLLSKLNGIASNAIANIEDDSSPQLGADLDVQSNKITTATSNGNVKIEPNGSGVVEVRGAGGNDGKLQLNCSLQSHGIKLASPAHSAGQSYTFIFPDNNIAADKYLKVKSISGSGSTATGQLEYASLDANDLGEGTIPDARFPSTLPALNGSALTNLSAGNISSGTISDARLPSSISSDITGNSATATKLATARTIAGVSFDGSANISLNNNNITNGAGYITATLTNEQVQDIVGGMVSGNTESGITVTYQDSDGTLDFSVASQTDNNFTNADHSKLDGIESGATADQSASEILTLIKTVDGAGSGLDADTLDGVSSGSFVRSDTADTATGVLTINGGLSFGADAKCPAAVSSLSDGSTITVNFTSGIHHSVTLGGNRTLSQSNNANAIGQSGSIFITQDGTGSRTLGFNSAYKFAGGTAPTLSTAANAVDRLDYVIKASGVIHCVLTTDVK